MADLARAEMDPFLRGICFGLPNNDAHGGYRRKGHEMGLADTIKGWFDKGGGAADDVAGKATEQAADTVDTGKDVAGQATDKTKDLGARGDGEAKDAS